MQHRTARSRFLPARGEILVVVVLISGGLLLLAPLFKGPGGKRIPTEAPDEERRLIHPAGFSIVVPPDWRTGSDRLSKSHPTLGIFPMHPLPVRYSASIYIVIRSSAPAGTRS